jgi:NAD(P)-dependent dehydrogenase (short-subunit alcohol dehydrogenase family)
MRNNNTQEFIVNWAKDHGNNVITRGLIESCYDLYKYESTIPNLSKLRLPEALLCYGCNKPVKSVHPEYLFSCTKCGSVFSKNRRLTRDLSGKVSLIIGSRTKLGHQCAIKLLDAGASVICTTRYPDKAKALFEGYNKKEWSTRLYIYPESLDLDTDNISGTISRLCKFIEKTFGRLDILVISAAQTIRYKEKYQYQNQYPSEAEGSEGPDGFEGTREADKAEGPGGSEEKSDSNRYNDMKFVPSGVQNSWNLELYDISQKELEETYRINAAAPLIIIQSLIPIMSLSIERPYIINVHAREGLFDVRKSDKHIHTNMAKASLAMLTKCLISMGLKTNNGQRFSIHGCDPGWISIDEYFQEDRPWIVPPLDEVDGASRILYPLFRKLGSCSKTRRHYNTLTY